MAERVAAARSGGSIRMGEVIKRIIARDNLELPVSPPARMPMPPTPQRSGPSKLNAHLPPFRCRVDSSDEDEPERQEWLPRRPHLEFDDGDYEQDKDIEPAPPKQRQNAQRRVNPFIDAEADVEGEASNEERSDNENNNFNEFIIADILDDIEI